MTTLFASVILCVIAVWLRLPPSALVIVLKWTRQYHVIVSVPSESHVQFDIKLSYYDSISCIFLSGNEVLLILFLVVIFTSVIFYTISCRLNFETHISKYFDFLLFNFNDVVWRSLVVRIFYSDGKVIRLIATAATYGISQCNFDSKELFSESHFESQKRDDIINPQSEASQSPDQLLYFTSPVWRIPSSRWLLFIDERRNIVISWIRISNCIRFCDDQWFA